MKWMLVAMCISRSNMAPVFCDPVQIYETKAECESELPKIRDAAGKGKWICTPDNRTWLQKIL